MKKRLNVLVATLLMVFSLTVFAACAEGEAPQAKTFYITFQTNGGNSIEQLEYTEGYLPNFGSVSDPEKHGYTFYGWFTDIELTQIYQVYNINFHNSNFVLYAKWVKSYKVSFELNGGEGDDFAFIQRDPRTEVVIFGELPTPERNGYAFKGWYFEDNFLIKVEKNNIVERDTTLHAKWAKIFSLSFETNGGTLLPEIDIAEGDSLFDYVVKVVPTKEGYVFDGWYINPELSIQALQTIISDTKVYAKWAVALTVSFDTNVGSEKAPIKIGKGQYLSDFDLGSDPKKEGFIFKGWFTDLALTQEFSGMLVQNDMTLYARWIPKGAVILTTQNFKDYFNISYSIKQTYVNLGQYYTYRNNIVYSISLKDGAYAQSIFSSESITITFQFEFYKPGYQSLYINEFVTLKKANNYAVANKVSAASHTFVETGVSARHRVLNIEGELVK